MLTDLTINLLAALIGFSMAQAYSYMRRALSRRSIKLFWTPMPSAKICLFHGAWANLLTDVGEREPVVNMQAILSQL